MNALVNIFLVFMFLILILYFRIPNIDNNNYILHKLILFLMLFIYQFVILLISNIKNNCKINPTNMFISSIETAIIGIIGYSIYTDLHFVKIEDFGDIMIEDDSSLKYLYVTIIITLLLTFVNTIKLLAGYTPYQCLSYNQ